MKSIVKSARIITKIIEVFHWIGAAMMAAAGICAVAAPQFVKYFVGITPKECCGAEMNVCGFEVTAPLVNGGVDMKALALFSVGATILLVLMALIFRNLNRMICNAETDTPFCTQNIALLKQVGFCSMAIPVVGLVSGLICRLVLGEGVETSMNLFSFCRGILVLCLTQFFIHGVELEQDVDGLL